MRLVALSPLAAELGLQCGMGLADARGQVRDLMSLPHDGDADADLLARITRHCITYTPSVMAEPPRTILLDITGCTHLHGGDKALKSSIAGGFSKRGFSVCIGQGNTPNAARALARYGGGRVQNLRDLPIAALEIGSDGLVALRRAGFRIIGDVADLPRAPLAARFGAEILRLLDRLFGREDPNITAHIPQKIISVKMLFAEPIARNDDVEDAIEALIEAAAMQLERRGQGGRAFAIRLERSDSHMAYLEIETGAPTRDAALLMRLFHERIDSLSDPLDPGFGYDAISLAVPRAEAVHEDQPNLVHDLEDGRAEPNIGPLLDRLATRYGPAALMHFTSYDSHLPERAGQVIPVRHAASGRTDQWSPISAGEPALRPLVLFDPPRLVQVIATIPDGPPRRFNLRGKQHLIQRFEGPERLASEWWRRKGGHADNPGLTRDYYRVEDETGCRFWLFRHGLYGRESVDPLWYVHGQFV